MTGKAHGRILVACVGNIFLGDDGFGCEMALELQSTRLPAEVTVVDFGIRGFDLAYALLEPWRAVVLVDAVARGGAPGALYLLAVERDGFASDGMDPHAMDPYRVLALAQSFGEITAPLYVLGCEAAAVEDDFEGRIGLSASVSAALPHARRMLEELIEELMSQPAAAAAAENAAMH